MTELTEAAAGTTTLASTAALEVIDESSKLFEIVNDTLQGNIELKNLTTIHFQWYDYVFFALLLGVSVVIGLYYAFFSRHKQNNTSEYILGGKSMKTLPVAVSLVSAHISGTTLLGLPSEVYSHGTQYIAFLVAAFVLAFTLIYIYIPLFYELQLTSSFQYLERRFDRHVRLFSSFIYLYLIVFFIPIVIYIPALAFNQVTGFNLYIVTIVTCSVCVFYTTIGGLRAVVWTDFLQFLVALGALISIIYLGTNAVGGVSNVFETAKRGGRLIIFNLDPNPLVRTSFWTVGFGMTVLWLAGLGLNQSSIQRFLSVPDLKSANRSVWIFVAGMIVIKFLALYLGLLVYAKYAHCDPIKSGFIEKPDQILPFYVLDIGRKVPGLPGLFIAGIFAGGLSAMSAYLNSAAGTIYEDFLKPHLPKATEKQASNYMKIIVVILGLIIMSMVFVIEKMGTVFQAGTSLSGLGAGCQLGIFTLGMTCKTVNTKGILTGAITSMLVVSFILIGAQISHVSKDPTLPIAIDECEIIFRTINETVIDATTNSSHSAVKEDEIFWMFRISFWYYGLLGLIIMVVVSYVVSILTGGYSDELDERLLTPLFRSQRYKDQLKENEAQYKNIDTALRELNQQNDA